MNPRLGVDVGQMSDPTAIAIVEPHHNDGGVAANDTIYGLRLLERVALGTPYPQVAERLADLVMKLHRKTALPVEIYIDATGVGRGPTDILRQALMAAGNPYKLHAVNLISGDNIRAVDKGGNGLDGRRLLRAQRELSVGKEFLVSRLKGLLQTNRVRGSRTAPWAAEYEALKREVLNFEVHHRPAGRDQYGAFKSGTHDDLVIAVALAVLIEARGDDSVNQADANRQLGSVRGLGSDVMRRRF